MAQRGAVYDQPNDLITFSVYSKNAQRVEIYLYNKPLAEDEKAIYTLTKNSNDFWTIQISLHQLHQQGIQSTVYYGFRAWGPNWNYVAEWKKGSLSGFVCDVDEQGNRFNPNKLLIDPYAKEISHDPQPRLSDIDPNEYRDDYYTGEQTRCIDTGAIAPKSIVLLQPHKHAHDHTIQRLLKDDIIYEAHVRGFTKLDSTIPEKYRGTYKGAGLKAGYLKSIGITAIEFLPVHEFADEQNDDRDPRADNYWGYMTLGYFAPNRRYSSDKSAGGPTKEFKDMVHAFHEQGIKVLLDVVYNHTAEGILKRTTDHGDSRCDDTKQKPNHACLLSLRGLDNASYYTLRSRIDLDSKRNQRYQDNSACGASLNVTNRVVSELIIDSLTYWVKEFGIDGFRFDLASVLGNKLSSDGFQFDLSDASNPIRRIVSELPARDPVTKKGIDLIAEPWGGAGDGTYQLGNFPDGWSEWNDEYRKIVRKSENKLGCSGDVLLYQLANHFSGSAQQFKQKQFRQNPQPYNSINYVASHDGHCLRDVFSYNSEDTWDHHQNLQLQKQAIRNAFALMMVSSGVPMICAGDEIFRSIAGHINVVAIDNDSVYLDWTKYNRWIEAHKKKDRELISSLTSDPSIQLFEFVKKIMNFRLTYECLRPMKYFTGEDIRGDGLKDITWYKQNATEVNGQYWSNPLARFLGFRINNQSFMNSKNTTVSIYCCYNRDAEDIDITLPFNLPNKRWYRLFDTASWMENQFNYDQIPVQLNNQYVMHERSVLILIEQ